LIHDLIKDHDVFKKKGPRGRRQTDVKTQLCVFLRFLGTEGSGASNHGQQSTFRVSYGFAARCRKRVARAFCSLAPQYITWPDEQERKQISKAFFELSQLSNCIAIIDGTLFPLYTESQCEDTPDCSGRKFPYSISTLIINDHKRRIHHYLAGFPGTSSDNRIWEATELFENPDLGQYLLGDSAFLNSHTMVASYKKPPGEALSTCHARSNTQVSKARISPEHTIGMLKSHCPW
jgi:hypothetical protein